MLIFDQSGKLRGIQNYDCEGRSTFIDPSDQPRPSASFFKTPTYHASNKKEWDPFLHALLSHGAQSVISMPCQLEAGAQGVILLSNPLKMSFNKQHHMLFSIMTHFLSIAIKNAENYEKTKTESERDPLTNLYNYRYFSKLLNESFEKADPPMLSIMMLDLDHFKKINDHYGHENGNKVLIQVAERLTNVIGNRGVVARYGGEEFIILLSDTTSESSYQIAQTLRKAMEEMPVHVETFDGGKTPTLIHVTASIGVATAFSKGDDPVTLIRNADRAMYSGAKQKGRNRVAVYTN